MAIVEPAHLNAQRGEKLLNRVAFVTGGTRGIGAAICLASQGATVAAGYSQDSEKARAFGEELSQLGTNASVGRCRSTPAR